MGPWRSGFLILLLVAGLLPVPAGGQQSDALTDHLPILIDGDEDFCNDEDGDGSVGQDDGIVNCEAANGTAEAPYVIEGWRIDTQEEPVCIQNPLDPPSEPPCGVPVSCEDDPFAAVIAVCRTTKHVVFRNLELRNDLSLVVECSPGGAVPPGCEDDKRFGTVRLLGASNVLLDSVRLDSYGPAIHVQGVHGEGGDEWPARNVTLSSVDARAIVPNSTANVNADDPLAVSNPLALVVDADVAILDSRFDATGRAAGMVVDARDDEARRERHAFSIHDSLVSNASRSALEVYGATAEIHGNHFVANASATARIVAPVGVVEVAGVPGATLVLGSLGFNVTQNRFDTGGRASTAILMETVSRGLVEQNQFYQSVGRAFAIALSSGFGCDKRIAYNDLNGLRVRNDETICTLDAPRNWWGSTEGPSDSGADPAFNQASGRVNFDEWLHRPLDELPEASFAAPAPGGAVNGRVEVSGEATSPAEHPLVRVELSRGEDAWESPLVATGASPWNFTWDLSAEPLGPLSVWARGCGADECGVPARLDVVHVPPGVPPIAHLSATPEVVRVGAPVRLDAALSYSPQGWTIVAYRFFAGEAGSGEWDASNSTLVTFSEPGSYVATVSVRDEQGLESVNAPRVTIRVLSAAGDGNGDGLFASVPGPGLVALLLAAALALLARPRRGAA